MEFLVNELRLQVKEAQNLEKHDLGGQDTGKLLYPWFQLSYRLESVGVEEGYHNVLKVSPQK